MDRIRLKKAEKATEEMSKAARQARRAKRKLQEDKEMDADDPDYDSSVDVEEVRLHRNRYKTKTTVDQQPLNRHRKKKKRPRDRSSSVISSSSTSRLGSSTWSEHQKKNKRIIPLPTSSKASRVDVQKDSRDADSLETKGTKFLRPTRFPPRRIPPLGVAATGLLGFERGRVGRKKIVPTDCSAGKEVRVQRATATTNKNDSSEASDIRDERSGQYSKPLTPPKQPDTTVQIPCGTDDGRKRKYEYMESSSPPPPNKTSTTGRLQTDTTKVRSPESSDGQLLLPYRVLTRKVPVHGTATATEAIGHDRTNIPTESRRHHHRRTRRNGDPPNLLTSSRKIGAGTRKHYHPRTPPGGLSTMNQHTGMDIVPINSPSHLHERLKECDSPQQRSTRHEGYNESQTRTLDRLLSAVSNVSSNRLLFVNALEGRDVCYGFAAPSSNFWCEGVGVPYDMKRKRWVFDGASRCSVDMERYLRKRKHLVKSYVNTKDIARFAALNTDSPLVVVCAPGTDRRVLEEFCWTSKLSEFDLTSTGGTHVCFECLPRLRTADFIAGHKRKTSLKPRLYCHYHAKTVSVDLLLYLPRIVSVNVDRHDPYESGGWLNFARRRLARTRGMVGDDCMKVELFMRAANNEFGWDYYGCYLDLVKVLRGMCETFSATGVCLERRAMESSRSRSRSLRTRRSRPRSRCYIPSPPLPRVRETRHSSSPKSQDAFRRCRSVPAL
ncbi:hypothetical protein J6590_100625 [Homalodisca vitripennis]|nr:hypothetical protein J6590_100625 [Homalodisca vitripennis]